MRMKAADTSASSAIADWTPLTVVSRSRTTAEIDTFISDVSTTSTNIAIASRSPRRGLPAACGVAPMSICSVTSPERPGLGPLELVLGEHALVAQIGEPGDLADRTAAVGTARDVLHVVAEGGLSGGRFSRRVFVHLPTPGDQVGEDPQIGQHDDEDGPQGLAPAREVGAPEDVAQDGEQEPDPYDEQKEPQHRPEDLAGAELGCEHGALPPLVGQLSGSASSASRARALAARAASVTVGQRRSRPSIVSATTAATSACITCLWSAGMTYHGAHGVEVAVRASSYAAMYSSHRARSVTSAELNFHSFPGLSSRAMKRRFCSARDTWRKNFTIFVPLRSRCRSKAL